MVYLGGFLGELVVIGCYLSFCGKRSERGCCVVIIEERGVVGVGFIVAGFVYSGGEVGELYFELGFIIVGNRLTLNVYTA